MASAPPPSPPSSGAAPRRPAGAATPPGAKRLARCLRDLLADVGGRPGGGRGPTAGGDDRAVLAVADALAVVPAGFTGAVLDPGLGPDGQWSSLAAGDGAADVVVCANVLQRVDDPEAALRSLARVARQALVVAVPREPLYRSFAVLTGRDLPTGGVPRTHRHHWRSPPFVRLASRVGTVRDVRLPLPWTVLWLRKV